MANICSLSYRLLNKWYILGSNIGSVNYLDNFQIKTQSGPDSEGRPKTPRTHSSQMQLKSCALKGIWDLNSESCAYKKQALDKGLVINVACRLPDDFLHY